MKSCLLRFAELAWVADIGLKVRRGDASAPRADKPEGYEPRNRVQEFARDC